MPAQGGIFFLGIWAEYGVIVLISDLGVGRVGYKNG